MEFTPPLSNLRTQLCMVLTGYAPTIDRDSVWTPGAEEFLRRMNRLGVQVTIVGPRPPHKFGSKKNLRFMERHELIGMKELAASRSHRLEFRILSTKTRAWTRLRAEACLTFGPNGVWPQTYEGWTVPGTLTIDSLARWVGEQKWIPGRQFVFMGSSNQVLRWASLLLDRGAKSCFVLEQGSELRCWRAHRDRFLSKGGRIFLRHHVQRVESEGPNALTLYLDNEQGTLVMKADTIVLAPVNDDALNAPSQWRRGLFYVNRRGSPWEPLRDEEHWLDQLDWKEAYYRIARLLGHVDRADADGALRALRTERRTMTEYRKPGIRRDFEYSGKILGRESLAALQGSPSVPRGFERAKPVASLECFENIACMSCVEACPEAAIEKAHVADLPKLLEDKCTGCGACVAECPAGAAVMVRDSAVHQKARYFLPDDTKELWREGRQLQLLNRRGEMLGTGRVVSAMTYEGAPHRILEIEATDVHVWEARGFRVMKGEFSANDVETPVNSPVLLKRGWVTLNGVRRLCPIDVPVTVALWQLGQRRFEDALFCHDGSCHLCEVTINGQPELACKALVRDGQEITFHAASPGQLKNPLCPCKQIDASEYNAILEEGISEEIAREITGLGQGTCHGRWCLASCDLSSREADKLRPRFHGYEASPWRDVWTSDVADSEEDTE